VEKERLTCHHKRLMLAVSACCPSDLALPTDRSEYTPSKDDRLDVPVRASPGIAKAGRLTSGYSTRLTESKHQPADILTRFSPRASLYAAQESLTSFNLPNT
jgi:hypothetical protein